MRVDHYTVPGPSGNADNGPAEAELKGRLLAAIAQETNSTRRQSLENAATLVDRLLDELQAYRDAAVYDFSRPKSMQFRGWNMGSLGQALRKTQGAR
jgi:hypothetical protein